MDRILLLSANSNCYIVNKILILYKNDHLFRINISLSLIESLLPDEIIDMELYISYPPSTSTVWVSVGNVSIRPLRLPKMISMQKKTSNSATEIFKFRATTVSIMNIIPIIYIEQNKRWAAKQIKKQNKRKQHMQYSHIKRSQLKIALSASSSVNHYAISMSSCQGNFTHKHIHRERDREI